MCKLEGTTWALLVLTVCLGMVEAVPAWIPAIGAALTVAAGVCSYRNRQPELQKQESLRKALQQA